MDLRSKLEKFHQDLIPQATRRPEITGQDIHHYIDGEEVVNQQGRFFYARTLYPGTHLHGEYPLNLIQKSTNDIFAQMGKNALLKDADIRKALFLDTETTGLAGGVGTVPFMIGLGRFTGDGFLVEQMFMRDYREEAAVLAEFRKRLDHAGMLISYNGRAYDMNVLASRMTLARMPLSGTDLPHLDLLHTARRLWRRRIGDCSLSNIEQQILGFRRENDVPGFLIPGLYFEYIRTGAARELAPVFMHNRFDIVSLAVLAGLAGHIYETPHAYLQHAGDWISLGRAFENLGMVEEAADCYQSAMEAHSDEDELEDALRCMGFMLKRAGKPDKAEAVWQRLVRQMPHRLYAYEELAKYYEHQTRNLDRARDIVKQALSRIGILESLYNQSLFSADRDDLEYRLRRLLRKMRTR